MKYVKFLMHGYWLFQNMYFQLENKIFTLKSQLFIYSDAHESYISVEYNNNIVKQTKKIIQP
jgi:hypothetical protein